MSEAEAACCMDKKRSSERVVAFRPPGKDVPVLETKGKRDLKKEKKKTKKKKRVKISRRPQMQYENSRMHP